MSTKCLLLSASTKNNSFEEIFNILTYTSSATKLKTLTLKRISFPLQHSKLKVQESPVKERIFFNGTRSISYSFISNMGKNICKDFPSEIDVKIEGSIDSDGKITLVTVVPEIYSKYFKGKETIIITSDGNINITLSYFIVPSTENGIFGGLKNMAYNNITSNIETHSIDMYRGKRVTSFGIESCRNITSLDSLYTELALIKF